MYIIMSNGYHGVAENGNQMDFELLVHGAKARNCPEGDVAKVETALSESSTTRPAERTNLLPNAATVEARCDTTINVEAER